MRTRRKPFEAVKVCYSSSVTFKLLQSQSVDNPEIRSVVPQQSRSMFPEEGQPPPLRGQSVPLQNESSFRGIMTFPFPSRTTAPGCCFSRLVWQVMMQRPRPLPPNPPTPPPTQNVCYLFGVQLWYSCIGSPGSLMWHIEIALVGCVTARWGIERVVIPL